MQMRIYKCHWQNSLTERSEQGRERTLVTNKISSDLKDTTWVPPQKQVHKRRSECGEKSSLHYKTYPRGQTPPTSPNLISSFSVFTFFILPVAFYILDILLHLEKVWLAAMIMFSFRRTKTKATGMKSKRK